MKPPPPDSSSLSDTQQTEAQQQWIRAAVNQYERPLIHYAARLVGDVDLARDVVQDTFLKLWTADRCEIEAHIAQWLYRVCRNRALDVRRREIRMTALDDRHVESRPDRNAEPASAAHTHEADGMLAILQSLPERQQEVIRLKFQGGLSYKEIANVMNLTVNHVGVLIHTGLKALREQLAAAGNSTNQSSADASVSR